MTKGAMTIDEVCRMFGVSYWTLYRLLTVDHAVEYYQIGRRLTVPPESVERLRVLFTIPARKGGKAI